MSKETNNPNPKTEIEETEIVAYNLKQYSDLQNCTPLELWTLATSIRRNILQDNEVNFNQNQ